MRRKRLLPRLLMLLLVAAAIIIVQYQFRHPVQPHLPPPVTGFLTVTFYDSGQGDSTLIQTSTGKSILIDTGPESANEALITDLELSGVHHLDLLIVTDSTQDHSRSVAAVVRQMPTGSVMDNGFGRQNPGQIKSWQAIGRQTLAGQWHPTRWPIGSRIPIGGGAIIQYLAPLPHFTSVRDTDNTIITRISLGQVSVLLTGNASSREIGTLLTRGIDVRATVLKIASHGAAINTSPSFLDQANPKEVIASHDLKTNVLPRPIEPDILDHRRIEVWRTDRQGTIQLRTNGTIYQLVPSRK